MKSSKKPWPLSTIYGMRDRINTNPDFQRPAVWGRAQKQLLVDTILRDYDVPKLYWRKTGSRPDTYDVVDGQQRLRTIWEFFSGDFRLPKDADPVDGESISNCTYESLPDEMRRQFDLYSLDVILLEDTDEDEVREMFLRLQNGTSLKAQEKRNAYPGQMRVFVHELTKHTYFSRVGFANSRFNHDLIAAQLVALELAGGPTNIKNADLNRMYQEQAQFDAKSAPAKSVVKTLNLLAGIFPDRTPELTRFNVVALYCVIAELQSQYVVEDFNGTFYDWFLQFETIRRQEEEKPEDMADPEWISYKERISHSTDAADSIRARMEFMLRHFLETHPRLRLKDEQRDFMPLQRLAVFRRDKGICQVKRQCGGDKVTWDTWHCDHRIAWTKGGLTTVENGQVACPKCNLSKGSLSA